MNKDLPRTYEKATFAGGCFWCIESTFETLDGVKDATSGYSGGHSPSPTYQEVASGKTGHLEAVQVTYDPQRITYQKLLETFFSEIDPTDPHGQFADRGMQYATAVFAHTKEQYKQAESFIKILEKSSVFNKPIATRVLHFMSFYPAETYHQDFSKKNPEQYSAYRKGSGRDAFIQKYWKRDGKREDKKNLGLPLKEEELRQGLSDLAYHVTQESGTEPPFDNEYWDHKKKGIYVDVVSGEALFSSKDKYNSGTGWPSFVRPLVNENIIEKVDDNHGLIRVEVRSKKGNSHLGHVFNDGPEPTGKRYCINSAALRFVPLKDLEEEGYGLFLSEFQTEPL